MITMKDIVREGHPALREKAQAVAVPPSKEDIELAERLLQFVKNSQDPALAERYDLRPGIGLASPQVGISKRIIAVHVEDENGHLHSHALLNPKIVSHSVKVTYLEGGEGCLSVDREVPGFVPRYEKITVKGINTKSEPVELKLKGLVAIVFQHEIDHLDGIMFYDRINKEQPFDPPSTVSLTRP
ncbi:peptide deformylase [Fictibacillus macauensis ZFHKF-1]|uniref:Peptide deformylase n=1 Tax=Fictibacillus macauensis ZFHKF-1 TaxID=1196324 RepID=I8AHR0_9BACL|nr:peptide deformylase [Fictibacillus macauensis]EIT84954.1 peptide deformylase [Fictibacillus macauensis ZFHKF-1]